MRQSNIIKILITILCLCIFCACTNQNQQKKEINHYISFTLTHTTNEDQVLEMNTYQYDLKLKKEKLISQLPFNTQYPLTYYDDIRNVVYYTYRINGNDELFEYNLKSKKSTQLTTDVFCINSIYKINKDNLLLFAVINNSSLGMWKYNLKTHNINKLSPNDFTIRAQTYLKNEGKIIIIGYNEQKEWQIRDDYNNGKISNYNIPYTMYEYNIKTCKLKKIINLSISGSITSLAANKKNIYYKSEYIDGKIEVYKINRKSKKESHIKQLDNSYYFIGINMKENEIIYVIKLSKGQSVLESMNLDTFEKKELFSHKDIEGQINNGFFN